MTTGAREMPKTAMLLAAGYGMRMRPLSDERPKCLLPVAGRATIDRALDHLESAGVETVVVNLHYKAAMIRAHLADRDSPRLVFSDESEGLLDTGGGVARALGALGPKPFFAVNAISLWSDAGANSLHRLAETFAPDSMDALLLLHGVATAIGYDGVGDFQIAADGGLARRQQGETAAHVFIGVQILRPELFRGCPAGPFSLNLLYDQAQAAGRLFGLRHDGAWMNLKTPDALAAAERALSGAETG